jgi:hypothetical protein
VALIGTTADGTRVQNIPGGADQTAEITVSSSGGRDRVTLVVAATTRFTHEAAGYEFEIK